MCLIGFGLMMYCFGESGFHFSNPYIWVGIGLAIGGGGCFSSAWTREEDESFAAIDVPLVHLVDVTAGAVRAAGLSTVALLGTRYTMASASTTRPKP